MGISREILAAMVLVLNGLESGARVEGSGFAVVDGEKGAYIVTNQHVAAAATKGWRTHLHIKGWASEQEKKEEGKEVSAFAIPEEWVAAERNPPEEGGIDLAVIRIPIENIEEAGRKISQRFINWETRVERQEITRQGWWEGTPTLTIGYPQGIGWEDKIGETVWPTVRGGIIARIQDWLDGKDKEFLIDGGTLGGQSGSPVFMRPYRKEEGLRLVGVVRGYLQHVDRQKDGEVLITGDAHLQIVVPIEEVEKLMREADSRWERWLKTQTEESRKPTVESRRKAGK